jgi:hypothetical protein
MLYMYRNMFRYIKHALEDAKIYTYNYFYSDSKTNKVYPKIMSDDEENDKQDVIIDDKQLRIDTLLFVRQFKNTYYKYTNKEKFNQELYNSFVDDKNFDGGQTAFDDDDQDVRIFDKYVLEYIKNRSDVITFLQCKNKDIVMKLKLEQLNDLHKKQDDFDIIFAIDMAEKDLFHYCYTIIQKTGKVYMIKAIVFSLILKYDGQYVRIKLNSFTKQKNNHPYLILERFL